VLRYVLRRLLYMIPTLFAISIVVFIIIQLPPGDIVTSLLARRGAAGDNLTFTEMEALREYYGVNDPILVQYWRWISGILLEGNFGTSIEYVRPVNGLIGERIPWTIAMGVSTLIASWVIAFPIGIYAAVRQYSIGDYVATTFGFLGLATPHFLIALILMYFTLNWFGYVPAGLCSPEWCDSAWNLGKLIDFLGHMWVPMLVLGTAGTAGLIRILRANLLDELHKPYVVAARARGVPERRLLRRYPLRVALNPFVSTVGWVLPLIFAGDIIVGQILGLPTMGPLLLGALKAQDMYLAGSLIMIISVLTVIGTLVSDLLLGWLDPRVRFGLR
jgi:peptide/nickel transport system permease protein